MLSPKQLRIFSIFIRFPYKEYTFKEIKKSEKSNSIVEKAIRQFMKEDIIVKRTLGNINLYALNLNNPRTLSYFYIYIDENLPNLAKKSLRTIKDELSVIPYKSIMIFGSYAENKQSDKSDLDIAVITEDKRECVLRLKTAQQKSLLSIDPHVFTKAEMLEMLKDKDENLGKEIARKHLAIENAQIFYGIMEEGMRNGFKIIYQESRK